MIRKTLATLALTAGVVASTAGTASAHECYIANRSDAGNAGASHSANWYTLQLSELFSHAHMFLGGAPLTEAQLQTALTMAADQGIPLSFTVFERFTIPRSHAEYAALTGTESGKGAKAVDGKGVDSFFVKYGDALVGTFTAAQQS